MALLKGFATEGMFKNEDEAVNIQYAYTTASGPFNTIQIKTISRHTQRAPLPPNE